MQGLERYGGACQKPYGERDLAGMNINRVVLTGNLTADPELRGTASNVCRLRVACNTRRKQQDGSWGDKPNYFDVVVFGSQVEPVTKFLKKGSPVAIDGRLEWNEWTSEAGEKRQDVQIVAETIQFLGGRSGTQTDDEAGSAADESDRIPY